MITHRNYYEMADEVRQIDDFTVTDDTMLLFLPLAHNFGRLTHLLGPHVGYTIAFCPDPYAVAEALPAVRPTVFPSVPRVYEKVHTAVTAKFDEATGVKRRLIDWALARRPRGEQAAPGRRVRCREGWPCSTASPTGSCTRR